MWLWAVVPGIGSRSGLGSGPYVGSGHWFLVGSGHWFVGGVVTRCSVVVIAELYTRWSFLGVQVFHVLFGVVLW